MRRVKFDRPGEPDVLVFEDYHLPDPGKGEVQIDILCVGLNRFETQFRRDVYAVRPVFPSGIGAEGVGRIRAVGQDVNEFSVGDRVTVLPTSPCVGTGMYAEAANVPKTSLVRSLEGASDEQDAAFWCAYLSAYEFLTKSPLKRGSYVLVTAAASSVGLALIQMIREMGCVSIATTRTREKADLLKQIGADHVVITEKTGIAAAVSDITKGSGVAVAVDSLGGRFLPEVVAATARDGAIHMYGSLSEPSMRDAQIALSMFALYRKTLGFATINSVIGNAERSATAQAYLRDGFARGVFSPRIDRSFVLDDVINAHRYLELGGQVGKMTLSTAT